MIPDFENACFDLEKKGDYSKPFKTFYGWHIVKLIDKKEIGSYEEMKPELQQKIDRSDRSTARSANFISKLKTEYHFSENREALQAIYQAADSTLRLGTWKAGSLKNLNSILMKIGEQEVEEEVVGCLDISIEALDFLCTLFDKPPEGMAVRGMLVETAEMLADVQKAAKEAKDEPAPDEEAPAAPLAPLRLDAFRAHLASALRDL